MDGGGRRWQGWLWRTAAADDRGSAIGSSPKGGTVGQTGDAAVPVVPVGDALGLSSHTMSGPLAHLAERLLADPDVRGLASDVTSGAGVAGCGHGAVGVEIPIGRDLLDHSRLDQKQFIPVGARPQCRKFIE